MNQTDRDEIIHDHNHDGVDRRGFLKCMAWAGTGALYVMQGGVLSSFALGDAKKKFAEGKYKSSEIYGSPSDPRLRQEYQEYLKKRLQEIRKQSGSSEPKSQ